MKIINTNPKPRPQIEWEPPIKLPEGGQTRGLLDWIRGWGKK